MNFKEDLELILIYWCIWELAVIVGTAYIIYSTSRLKG